MIDKLDQGGGIVFRPATLEDAADIAIVRVQGWRTTYRNIMPDSYLDEMQIDDSIQHWTQVLSAPADKQIVVYVAEQDEEVVGFAAGIMLPEQKLELDAELTGLFIAPKAQGQGIGTRLVQLLAQGFADFGANGLLAWVLSENKDAREFFEALGGELLIEQGYTWDDLELMEVGYGWRDLPSLARG